MHRGRSHTPTPARAAAARRYRNLVGIPGGTKSPLAKTLVAASTRTDDKLDFAVGKGACSADQTQECCCCCCLDAACRLTP
jgi:hypothetical protein